MLQQAIAEEQRTVNIEHQSAHAPPAGVDWLVLMSFGFVLVLVLVFV
ncbi:MAG: hypothetical protein JOY91_13440 [Sinobacteraceae bacterium]|nr:hypothetical protein [Nevskiaceae bacterium]